MVRPPARSTLVHALEAVPPHPAPRADLEQYRTPPEVAAELILGAWDAGDIQEKTVLDLGCGTGMLSVAAALCGAKEILAVDLDRPSLGVAQQALDRIHYDGVAETMEVDLREWHPGFHWDTVVMNPPFGAQRGNRNADRIFYQRAAEAIGGDGAIWFLSQTRSESFLAPYLAQMELTVEKQFDWKYPLPAQYHFHAETARVIHVGGYRAVPE